jgi:hypothetical protein
MRDERRRDWEAERRSTALIGPADQDRVHHAWQSVNSGLAEAAQVHR